MRRRIAPDPDTLRNSPEAGLDHTTSLDDSQDERSDRSLDMPAAGGYDLQAGWMNLRKRL